MALLPSNKPYLTGGIQSTADDAGLRYFVPEIWGDSIKDYMEKRLVVGAMAQDLSPLVAGGGDLIHLPKNDEIVAQELYASGAVEALATTPLAFDDTTTPGGEYQLLVNQSAYAAVAIADLVMAQGGSGYDFMNMYTQKLGYALGKHIEAYLMFKLLNHVSYNYNGGTADGNGAGNNIALTTGAGRLIRVAGIAAMIQAVYETDSDLDEFVAVLCPETYASLFTLDDFARYDVIGNSNGELPRVSGYVGKLGGIDVVVSNNFRTSTDSAYTTTPVFNKANGTADYSDHLAGFLIKKNAIKIAYASGMKARVQSDYSLTTLATQFVADSVYGCAIVGDGASGSNRTVWALCDAD